ncbi:MAG TPA: outer membrane beta-barrel protein [Chitinophagaceae bacterium]|nr:outer membrane beta-barrel protein [Chitinophagaceae bacterium]
MKSLLLIFICSCLIFTRSLGQNAFGFRGGAQLSRMSGFEGNPKGFLPTIQGKAIAIVALSETVTLNPSFGYSGKGFKWNDINFTDEYGNPLGEGDIHGLFNYLQLSAPLSYKIAINPNKEFYFGAGPYFAYALSARGKVKHTPLPNAEESWNLFTGDSYKKTDAGIAIEISTRLRKKYMVTVNLDFGLSDVNNGPNKIKNQSAGISFGYLFNKS